MLDRRLSDITLSQLSDKARQELTFLYNTDPETIHRLCNHPGRVGELAKLCAKVGDST